jgi:hypothetical protein
MKLYELTPEVYITYISRVKHNQNTSWDLCRRKLTRNILLSDKILVKNGIITYRYGCLEIEVKDDKIIHIENTRQSYGFEKDMDMYNKLNKLLGITEDDKNLSFLQRLLIDIKLKFVNIKNIKMVSV